MLCFPHLSHSQLFLFFLSSDMLLALIDDIWLPNQACYCCCSSGWRQKLNSSHDDSLHSVNIDYSMGNMPIWMMNWLESKSSSMHIMENAIGSTVKTEGESWTWKQENGQAFLCFENISTQ